MLLYSANLTRAVFNAKKSNHKVTLFCPTSPIPTIIYSSMYFADN